LDEATDDFVGKKVFFVLPNSVIQKEMVTDLIRQEYEICLVPSISDARRVFSRYPDCLAFLNIDEGLSEGEWLSFVESIQSNPAFSKVRLGVLSYNADPELSRKYLMDRMVPCGFIKLSLNLVESTQIVAKVLEANEAKGRRKYLRVHCGEKAFFNFNIGEELFEGKIVDISSVGMSCTFNSGKSIEVHRMVQGIQLKLKGNLCLVDGVVMGRRRASDSGEDLVVILFDSKTSLDQKGRIRGYIQSVLQSSIASL